MASGYMFSQYWPGDGVSNAPPPVTLTQYPAWQSSIVCSILLLLIFG